MVVDGLNKLAGGSDSARMNAEEPTRPSTLRMAVGRTPAGRTGLLARQIRIEGLVLRRDARPTERFRTPARRLAHRPPSIEIIMQRLNGPDEFVRPIAWDQQGFVARQVGVDTRQCRGQHRESARD